MDRAGVVNRRALRETTGMRHEQIRRAMAELESYEMAARIGETHRIQYVVILSRVFGGEPGGCVNCHGPSNAGRFCARCKSGFRHDRAWKDQATQMLAEGKTPYAIAVAVGRPLRTKEEGEGEHGVVGVIDALVADGLLHESWMRVGRDTGVMGDW